MKVRVCIGSCCHKRGSYKVLERLKELVEQNGLSGTVSVGSAFCLNHCEDGISVAVDDDVITGIGMGNVDQLFSQYIAGRK